VAHPAPSDKNAEDLDARLPVSVAFPYKRLPGGKGGSYDSAIALVSLALPPTNAPRSRRFEACVDSGASSFLFHAAIGRAI
jgi:hypothetical protein